MIDRKQADSACAWWRALQPDPGRGQRGDRAALARLRRVATVVEAMQERATLDLFRRCKGTEERDLPAVALAAAVLARVRKDVRGPPVARALGPTGFDAPETARLSPLRLRRLLEAQTPDEQLVSFRRLVMLAGGEVNLADLAASLFDWGEWRRQHWIYTYWNATAPGTPAPAAASDNTLPPDKLVEETAS